MSNISLIWWKIATNGGKCYTELNGDDDDNDDDGGSEQW